MSVKSDKHKRCTRSFDNSSVELNWNWNLLTTTLTIMTVHMNNHTMQTNNTDTRIHNIRVMSIEQ